MCDRTRIDGSSMDSSAKREKNRCRIVVKKNFIIIITVTRVKLQTTHMHILRKLVYHYHAFPIKNLTVDDYDY